MSTTTFSIITHHGKEQILVKFGYHAAMNQTMHNVPGAKWSNSLKGWVIPDTTENRKRCSLPEKE